MAVSLVLVHTTPQLTAPGKESVSTRPRVGRVKCIRLGSVLPAASLTTVVNVLHSF